ncbi:MAG: hypothetical protein HFE52_02595 [Clostridia bacterium]|nr:hypothetical protein [Clostridia bacterium]MCI8979538.1 hypothetical protein [Clostridia bacterium]
MKKRIVSLTLIMAMIFTQISFISVFAETTDTTTQTPIESAFTDANFLKAVRTIIGKTNGEPIYPSDVDSITKLNIERKRIANLAGIEYFTGLKEVYATSNRLTSADFSHNEQLEVIDCSYNTLLGTLNVSNNSKLKVLVCNYAKLTDLDVSNNPNLTRLICYSNKLRGLHIDKNPLLKELDAKGMGLARIDMSNNPNLEKVNITQNYISEENVLLPEGFTLDSITYTPQKTSDLSGTFTDSKLLECVRNSINKPDGNIYPNDVKNITVLDVEDKKLTSLDGIEHLQALETLNCSSNVLTDLDVSNNPELQNVDCSSNVLTDLNVSNNLKLQKVNCGANLLTDLDVSNNSELQSVDCYLNNITTLDFTNNTELTDVHAHNNALEDINISENAQLKNVDVSFNALSTIDISSSNSLNDVNISNNRLASDEDITLSDKYPSNLMEIAKDTGYDMVPTNDAEIEIFPQFGRSIHMEVYEQDGYILDVGVFYTSDATFEVLDVTDCEGIDEFADEEMPYETEFNDTVFKEKIDALTQGAIPQTIDVQELTLEDDDGNIQGLGEYEGTVTLDGKRDNYKILIVGYMKDDVNNPEEEPHIQAAQVRFVTMIIDPIDQDPSVVEFKLNNGNTAHTNSFGDFWYGKNGKGDVYDILSHSKPEIWFYGGTYYVYVKLDNYDNVENVIITMSRNYNRNEIASQYVVLNSTGGGVFTGSSKIGTGGDLKADCNTDGQIHVSYTKKDEIVEDGKEKTKFDIDTYYAHLLVDPSGYIYEGVPSNRLRDVKTSIYYKGRNGETLKWDAAKVAQKNPIFTNNRGMFEWAVPAGKWQVKAEKEGYETYYTKWMTVPPAQMDVNFSMISTAEPEIKQITAYPDGIEIQFNKYMYSEDMTAENINVTLDGIDIIRDIELMDEEQDYWISEHGNDISGGTGNYYVSRIKVKPRITLMKDESVDIAINKDIRTYAGITMTENYGSSAVVEKRPTGISVYKDNGDNTPPTAVGDEGYSLTCGTTQDIKVQITPVDSSIGKKLYLVTDNDWAVSLPDYVTIDNDGWATIPVEAMLPLDVKVSMYLDGSGLAKEITMSVISE